MPGILDSLNDPSTQGALSLASNLMRASGPSAMPVPFGAALGNAYQGYLVNQGDFLKQRQTQQLIDLEKQKGQLNDLQIRQLLRNQQIGNDLLSRYLPGIGGGPTGSSNPQAQVASPGGAGVLSGQASPTATPALTQPDALGIDAAMRLPGVLTQALGAQSQMPFLSSIGKSQFEASKGIAARPGAPIVNPITGQMIAAPAPVPTPGVAYIPDPSNPTGWRASPVPGAAESAATQAGATAGSTAAAQAPYKLVEVELADGRKIKVPESTLVGPGHASPATSWSPLPADLPPADRAAAEQVRAAADRGEGKTVSVDPWSAIPKMQTPQGFGQSTYQKGTAEAQASTAAELAKKYGETANISNQRLAYNSQALDLVDKATTGPMALSLNNVKNYLTERVGIPAGVMDKVIGGDQNATAALNKDLLNAATQKAKAAYGARMTQSEVMLQIKQGAPNVDMTKATIKYLLSTDNAMAQYQVKQANDLGQYINRGGDPYQFEGWYAKSFPMSAPVSEVKLPGNRPPLSAFQK